MEEGAQQDEYNQAQYRRRAVLLIDCNESAFQEDTHAFKTTITAAFKYYDDQIMLSKGKAPKLVVILCHPETTILIDQELNAIEAYKKLYELSKCSNAELRHMYLATSKRPFADYLGKALQLAEKHGWILYATTTSDPTIDEKDRFNTFTTCTDMQMMLVRFDVLPLSQDNFTFDALFEEVYKSISGKVHRFYYNLDALTDKLVEAVHFRERQILYNLYPYLGCPNPLRVARKLLTNSFPGFDDTPVHKTTLEVLQPCVTTTRELEYFVNVHSRTSLTQKLTEEQYKEVTHVGETPTGITLLESRKLTEKTYSDVIRSHRSQLIGPHFKQRQQFNDLWDALRDLRTLCLIRLTRAGVIRHAELTAVNVEGERHFLVRFIPFGSEIYDVGCTADPLDFDDHLGVPLKKLVKAMTISDFGPILRSLCPPETAKRAEYAKGEVLDGYRPATILDYVDVTWHDASEETVRELNSQMEAASINIKKRRLQ